MKKILSILLLASFILPFYGGFLYLVHRKHQVKKEVKRRIISGIDRDELVLLKFSKESAKLLDWQHDKEFGYKGEMYDVVEREVLVDSISFWCWWDNDETILKKRLEKLLADRLERDAGGKEHAAHFLQLLKTLYHLKNVPDHTNFYTDGPKQQSFYQDLYLSIVLSPPAPPPKACCA